MSPPRRARPRHTPRRLGALALTAVLVGAGVGISAQGAIARPRAAQVVPDVVVRSAQSSAFYCAGLGAVRGTLAGVVAIADLASTPKVVEVTASDNASHVALREVRVTPGHVVRLHPGAMVPGSSVAAVVVADGGGVAVTEGLEGVNGRAAAPCASSTGTSWWVVGGSTEPDHSFVLQIDNPNASRAVADVTLWSPTGQPSPTSYAGLVLAPHELLALSVHAVAPNESPISAHVVATEGSVVATGVERGTHGEPDLSLLAGTQAGARALLVPVVPSDPGTTSELQLVNLGTAPATASVTLRTSAPCGSRCPIATSVDVPPGGIEVGVQLAPTFRVPSGEPFGAVVTSTGGGIAGTLVVRTGDASGAMVPLGATARDLVVVDPLAVGFAELVLCNPTARTEHVTLRSVGPRGEVVLPESFTLAPSSVRVLGVGAWRGMLDGVLELRADGPLSAAAVLHGGNPGSAILPAVPLG